MKKQLINLLKFLGVIIGTILVVFIIESFLLFVFTGQLGRISMVYPEIFIPTAFFSVVVTIICILIGKDFHLK